MNSNRSSIWSILGKVGFVLFLSAIFAIGLLPCQPSFAQAPARPDRGITPLGTYAVSDIENVNLSNGNVNLSIPLAGLPPIAGGRLSYVLRAVYNSKVWDATRQEIDNPIPGEPPPDNYVISHLQVSPVGGWTVGGVYSIDFEDSQHDFDWLMPTDPNDPDYYRLLQYQWKKVTLRTPDGAIHELRPNNSTEFDGNRDYLRGYFNSWPDTTHQSMSYYSVDGSRLWAVINPSASPVSWTVYFPDGMTVQDGVDGQRIRDTNGNSLKIYSASTYDPDHPENPPTITTHYVDEGTGREMLYVFDPNGNEGQGIGHIEYQAVGANPISIDLNFGTTSVQWLTYSIADERDAYPCNGERALVFAEIPVLRSIVLPATEDEEVVPRRHFTFSYNSDNVEQRTLLQNPICGPQFPTDPVPVSTGWGALSHMELPSGAAVDYVYNLELFHFANVEAMDPPQEHIMSKTVTHDGASDVWSYDISPGVSSVVNPGGSTIDEWSYEHDLGSFLVNGGEGGYDGLVYRENQSGKKVIERHWIQLIFSGASRNSPGGIVNFNPVVDAEYTTLVEGGVPVKMSAKTYQFDYNGNVTQETEYDWFDPGSVSRDAQGVPTGVPAGATVLRVTNSSYYNQASGSSSANVYAKRSIGTATPLILNALKETTVGASDTQLSYDGQSYGIAPTKGNLTKESRWDNINNRWSTTQHTYDNYGNRTSTTDPNGHLTYFYFDDATHAQPNRIVGDPLNGTGAQTTSIVYDNSTGRVTSQTDPNGNVTTTDYTNQLLQSVDPFARAGVVAGPLVTGGHRRVVNLYHDTARRTEVKQDLALEGDALLKSQTTLDPLGRVVLTEASENGTSYSIRAHKVYSYLPPPLKGQVTFTSNPTRGIGEPTDGWTRTTQDELGRIIEVATFSGGQPPLTGTNQNWTGSVTTTYYADQTTVVDQAGKPRRSLSDPLGRLIRVDEPDKDTGELGPVDSPAQPTSYQYDALDDLVHVTQGGQHRYFMYDSLKRLVRARNPEQDVYASIALLDPLTGNDQWSMKYVYDNAGNLTSKTDARGVVTTYAYDALNRVKTRSYGGATGVDWTPTVTYTYDVGTGCNFKGRLTQVTNSNSTTNYTCYDAMGRVLGTSQVTGGQTYAMSYGYNLAGGMTTQAYPSGREVTTGYDPAGRMNGLSGPQSKIYATTFLYAAHGGIASMNLGNTLWEHSHFNGRLQPDEIGLGTSNGDSSKLKLEYAYNTLGAGDNNGNVLSQKITFDTLGTQTVIQQGYSYDPLNRLLDANETGGWHQTYTYDRYGNRTTVDNHGGIYLPTFSLTVSQANNRITDPGFNYDAAGNLKQQPDTPGATTYKLYTYDAENRLTKLNGGAATYVYDGDGRRVKKMVDASITTYVYNAQGQLVAEYTNTSPTGNGGTSYLTADHLGSTRVVTDSNANVIARHDFLPFGEEVGEPYGGRSKRMGYDVFDSTNQRFTSKERDAESGLDYFGVRYFSSRMARFTIVDPASPHFDEPQSLNRYSYTINNPLVFVDSDGKDYRKTAEKLKEAYQKTKQAIATAAAKTKEAWVSAANEVGSVYSENPNFSISNITRTDLNNIGKNLTLAIAVGEVLASNASPFDASPAVTEAPAPSNSPNFLVSPAGEAIIVPEGATGPLPVENSSGNTIGFSFKGGSGGPGLNPRVNEVQVKDPTPQQGASPGYPGGNVSYYNSQGQKVNSATGQTVSNSDPSAHVPLNPAPKDPTVK
ncbi:MAG: hypothetical protein LAO21_23230 [Acidobacteriia bacterium]|nr:hypothetical protein [Terriglobia bacterium]